MWKSTRLSLPLSLQAKTIKGMREGSGRGKIYETHNGSSILRTVLYTRTMCNISRVEQRSKSF